MYSDDPDLYYRLDDIVISFEDILPEQISIKTETQIVKLGESRTTGTHLRATLYYPYP